MLRTTTALATVASFLAVPALAQKMDEPEPEPVVEAPAPVPAAPATPDWTGFYGGAQLGWANVDVDGFDDEDSVIGGLTAGYDFDLQNGFVLGAGVDYDWLDADVSNDALGNVASVEEVFRAKLRGGYKIGRGLLYGTGGYAWADTDNVGDGDGYFAGAGYEHLVTDNFSLGAEALYHDVGSFDGGADADVTTVQARGTFRF